MDKLLYSIQSLGFMDEQVFLSNLDYIKGLSLPYYIEGEHISPISHVSYVLAFAEILAKGEGLNDDQVKVLLIASALHDVGNCRCTLKKVVESDLSGNVSAAKDMVNFRGEHMVHGRIISKDILRKASFLYPNELPEKFIDDILRLVGNHDNFKISKYDDSFVIYRDQLMVLLNEADALWRLTPLGIMKDIVRGSKLSIELQVKHNLESVENIILSDTGRNILRDIKDRIKESHTN